MISEYYNRAGRPCSREQWSKDRRQFDRRVARTVIGDITVSTVWIGLNDNFDNDEGLPPLIFETMVLEPDEEWRRQYSTGTDARRGHDEICAQVRKAKA